MKPMARFGWQVGASAFSIGLPLRGHCAEIALPGVGGELLYGVFVLFALLAVMIVGLLMFRRVLGLKTVPGAVSLIGGVPVGSKERVVLLEVNGTRILVGVSPGQVQALHVFGDSAQPSFATTVSGECAEAERRCA